jgi:O-antigen ligase/tetratricopeptide (TPR) repeat protein
LIGLVASSATHALDRRPAINLAWEWIALGMTYLLLRHLPRTRGESSALAAALVATAFAVSVYGLYQGGVELPQIRKEYEKNPDRFVARHPELGIAPGSREQFLFGKRLVDSIEPTSTFALTNSLAGFIVGPLVLALAVVLHNLARREEVRVGWVVLFQAALMLLIMLVCLLLTKSRSAYIGLLVGLGIVAWQWRRQVSPRLLLGAGLAVLLLVTGLVAIGLRTGLLDRLVLTQSELSLRYRWEYYQGTWLALTGGSGNIAGALRSSMFWSGVGPGNFRAAYLRYKLPQASEEIQDPHNLFLEVWATAGISAVLALLAALGLGLWNLLGPPARSKVVLDAAHPPRSETGASRKPAVPEQTAPRSKDEAPDAPPCRPLWLILAAGAGWILVLLLLPLNLFMESSFPRWLILGGSWLAAVLLGAPLWRRLPIPATAVGAAVVAILINLLAAGGIGIPTVALGFWSLLALGLNLRDDRTCSRLREFPSRIPPFVLSAVWAAALGLFLGAVVPYWRAEAAISEAEEATRPGRAPEFERAERAYQRAIVADHYYARPWLKYAALELDAWVWRGAKFEDNRWKKIPELLRDAVTLPRNPNAWSLHMRRAEAIRGLLQKVGSQLAPIDLVSYGGEIVKETRTATFLYPSNAMLHARLAESSAEISMFGDAIKEAEEALRLDQLLNPHPDKRLPASTRQHLKSLVPEWKSRIHP